MKILIGYDGSECADAALADLRRAGLPRQADVIVEAVTETWLPPPAAIELVQGVSREQENLVLADRARVSLQADFPHWNIDVHTDDGSPASVLIERAEAWQPDLIVIGSHGRSALGRFFFGSVSQKVLHLAPCSVRIGRVREGTPVKSATDPVRIIIGVDGSRDAEAAIQAVAARHWPKGSQARLVNGSARLTHAVSGEAALALEKWFVEERARIKQMIDDGIAQLCATGLFAAEVLKEEEPKKLLCAEAEAWQADVIFVGVHGAGRLERFLIGSVSSGVAARAGCSVEVIRSSAQAREEAGRISNQEET